MKEYKIRPAEEGPFPVNEELAGVVPMAARMEQEALMFDISQVGQKEPVVLWRGEIVDGRCRQKALTVLDCEIRYKELDDSLTEEEVRAWVKSANTRRNLTEAQKAAAAVKYYLENQGRVTIALAAKSWGVAWTKMNNALWLQRHHPATIDALFDGKTVAITNSSGKAVESTKITAIYAYFKKQAEQAVEDSSYGWVEGSNIRTQAGKEWYYKQIAQTGTTNMQVKTLLAELANYKFTTDAEVSEEVA